MDPIRIMHVFPDDKFFDGTSEFYDSLEGVRNLYYYYTNKNDFSFEYIKRSDKIKFVSDLIKYLKLFSNKDIDIILFHSLPTHSYFYFPFIDKSKIVIWWAWGYDIYNESQYLPSLLPINLYKPITKSHYDRDYKKSRSGKAKLFHLLPFSSYLLNEMRRKAVSRVNYMIPVLPIDYMLLKEKCPYFSAKRFVNGDYIHNYKYIFKKKPGNVLVGNSLSYTNNHLDIFELLYSIKLRGRKYVIPINYGDAYGNPESFVNLTKFNKDEVIWIKDYLDSESYFGLFNSISHAIFGIIRQQAMGNIYYCLRTGIKVFMYKDSVVYQQLKEWGFIIYSIDDDLNVNSLEELLTPNEAHLNFDIYNRIINDKDPNMILEQLNKILICKE